MIAAASAALMTGCSQSSEVIDNYESESTKAAATEETPVTFGTYLSSAVTRAGKAGDMITNTLQQETGFGIFGYYTDGTTYSQSVTPNFMYNQKVEYKSGAWTYSPLKYWPNETGTTNIDGNGAVANGADHLSFFAYAPYVSESTTWTNEIGISGMSINSKHGDPTISYKVATDPSKSVDLLWGVIPANQTWKDVTGVTTTWEGVTPTQTNTSTNVYKSAGLPYTDLIKPTVGTKVNFLFRHALAKLDIKVAGAFDQKAVGGEKGDVTKIAIEKIEITSSDYKGDGVLNLNNTEMNTPNWDLTSSDDLSLTLDEEIKKDLRYPETKDSYTSINGVSNSYQPVFSDDNVLMVIPATSSTTPKIQVKITYYTYTPDAKLQDGYSEVKNVITKDIEFKENAKLEAGFKYTFNLLLGMTSVNVTATVDDWNSTNNEKEVDLPINVE